MKTKTKIFTGLSILIIALSSPAFAGDYDCHKKGGEGGHFRKGFERMINKLDLTEQQKEQIRDIRSANKGGSEEGRKAKHHFKEQLMESAENGASDEELLTMMNAHHAAQAEKMLKKIKTRQEVLAILTPEQRETLKELKEKRKEKREKRLNQQQ